jgi:hypothetical protein
MQTNKGKPKQDYGGILHDLLAVLPIMGLVIWISWVDDFLACRKARAVFEAKTMMAQMVDCDDVGIMNKYVGCKIDRDLDEPSLRMTQPEYCCKVSKMSLIYLKWANHIYQHRRDRY